MILIRTSHEPYLPTSPLCDHRGNQQVFGGAQERIEWRMLCVSSADFCFINRLVGTGGVQVVLKLHAIYCIFKRELLEITKGFNHPRLLGQMMVNE